MKDIKKLLDEAIKKIEEAKVLIVQMKKEETLLHGSSMLSKDVKKLELQTRVYNCLKNEGLHHIGDLIKRSDSEILRIPNLGIKGRQEIKEALSMIGLDLNMENVKSYKVKKL